MGHVSQTREQVFVSERRERVPRVMPVGRFPRVDELPQLINVLKGDMSPVGPRPQVFGMLPGGTLYREPLPRSAIPPGIAGRAQVNGLRDPADNRERARARIDCDFAYIQKFSFWLDLKYSSRPSDTSSSVVLPTSVWNVVEAAA